MFLNQIKKINFLHILLVIFQKLMNVLVKTMKITIEFDKAKPVEVIFSKIGREYLKKQVSLQENLRKQTCID